MKLAVQHLAATRVGKVLHALLAVGHGRTAADPAAAGGCHGGSEPMFCKFGARGIQNQGDCAK